MACSNFTLMPFGMRPITRNKNISKCEWHHLTYVTRQEQSNNISDMSTMIKGYIKCLFSDLSGQEMFLPTMWILSLILVHYSNKPIWQNTSWTDQFMWWSKGKKREWQHIFLLNLLTLFVRLALNCEVKSRHAWSFSCPTADRFTLSNAILLVPKVRTRRWEWHHTCVDCVSWQHNCVSFVLLWKLMMVDVPKTPNDESLQPNLLTATEYAQNNHSVSSAG